MLNMCFWPSSRVTSSLSGTPSSGRVDNIRRRLVHSWRMSTGSRAADNSRNVMSVSKCVMVQWTVKLESMKRDIKSNPSADVCSVDDQLLTAAATGCSCSCHARTKAVISSTTAAAAAAATTTTTRPTTSGGSSSVLDHGYMVTYKIPRSLAIPFKTGRQQCISL